MYNHLRGHHKLDAPVKFDNQGLKSSPLPYNLIYLWQTVSESVDSVGICAETTGK